MHRDAYCREKGFSSYFATSAKDNVNVSEAAEELVRKILENDRRRGYHNTEDSGDFASTEFPARILMVDDDNNNTKKKGQNCSC